MSWGGRYRNCEKPHVKKIKGKVKTHMYPHRDSEKLGGKGQVVKASYGDVHWNHEKPS